MEMSVVKYLSITEDQMLNYINVPGTHPSSSVPLNTLISPSASSDKQQPCCHGNDNTPQLFSALGTQEGHFLCHKTIYLTTFLPSLIQASSSLQSMVWQTLWIVRHKLKAWEKKNALYLEIQQLGEKEADFCYTD